MQRMTYDAHLVLLLQRGALERKEQVRRHDLAQLTQAGGDVREVGLHARHAEDDTKDVLLHLHEAAWRWQMGRRMVMYSPMTKCLRVR